MTLALYGKPRSRQWLLVILGLLAIAGAAAFAFLALGGARAQAPDSGLTVQKLDHSPPVDDDWAYFDIILTNPTGNTPVDGAFEAFISEGPADVVIHEQVPAGSCELNQNGDLLCDIPPAGSQIVVTVKRALQTPEEICANNVIGNNLTDFNAILNEAGASIASITLDGGGFVSYLLSTEHCPLGAIIEKELVNDEPDANNNLSWTVELTNPNSAVDFSDPQTYYVFDDLSGLNLQTALNCGPFVPSSGPVYECTVEPETTGTLYFWSPAPGGSICEEAFVSNVASTVTSPNATSHGPSVSTATYYRAAQPNDPSCEPAATFAVCKIIAPESAITEGEFEIRYSITPGTVILYILEGAGVIQCDDIYTVDAETELNVIEDVPEGWTASYSINGIPVSESPDGGVDFTPLLDGCDFPGAGTQTQVRPGLPNADCVVVISNDYTGDSYDIQLCKAIREGSTVTSGAFTLELNNDSYETDVDAAGHENADCVEGYITVAEGQEVFVYEDKPDGWADPRYYVGGVLAETIRDGGVNIDPETCTVIDDEENDQNQEDLRIEAQEGPDCIVIVENNFGEDSRRVPIEICKEWQHNEDGVTEPMADFTFEVDQAAVGTLSVAEGGATCMIAYVPHPELRQDPIVIEEVAPVGFEHANGYPKINIQNPGQQDAYETEGTSVTVLIGSDPIGCIDTEVFPQGLVIAEQETPWCIITFTNRSDPGDVLSTGAIEVCKEFVDNEDGVTVGPTEFDFTVNGSPFGPIVVSEGQRACNVALVELGVPVTVTELPSPIDDAPGFPRVASGDPLPDVSIAEEGNSYTVTVFLFEDLYICGSTIFLLRIEPLAIDVETQTLEPACSIIFYNQAEEAEEDKETPSPSPTQPFTGCTNISQCGPVVLNTATPTPTNTAVPPTTVVTDPPPATATPEEDVEGERTPGADSTPIAPDTGSSAGGGMAAGLNLLLAIVGILLLGGGITIARVARRSR